VPPEAKLPSYQRSFARCQAPVVRCAALFTAYVRAAGKAAGAPQEYCENIPAIDLEEAVIQRLRVVAHDSVLLAKLVRESHSDESTRLEHLRSLLMSKVSVSALKGATLERF
jgi:hypothetical protein